jgi:biotin transport system substrate-specific component
MPWRFLLRRPRATVPGELEIRGERMSTVTETLKTWAAEAVVEDRRARAGVGVLAFVLATSFGAQVAVPLPWTPVPMTLQPLFVILAGAMLGPRLGAAAMAIYLGIGAAGAPVFSNGGFGLPWLFGPTGGYLIAAPAAAFVVGTVARRGSSWLRTSLGLSLGVVTMYVGGVSQLLILTGQSITEVFALAVVPFLLGDVTKVLMALVAVRGIKPMGLGRD